MEVVVLGLLSALLWGSGDFGGGLLGRPAPVLGVVWVTLASGLVATIVLALVRAEPVPAGTDVAWSLAAGVAGIVGVTALYHGLAVGRMGVVAPTTGVLAAVVPVVVGFGLEGLPPATAVAGIVAAIVAVVLVTRSPGHADGRPSGAGWGLLAGAGIGLFNVFAGQLSPAGAFAPFVLMRVVQLLALTAFIRLRHQPWRMKRSVAVRVTLVGLLDMGGNVGYILAAQAGALAIAAVLSSLYPVVTVLLAIGVLHERVTPAHVVGIGFTVLAIVLIGVA